MKDMRDYFAAGKSCFHRSPFRLGPPLNRWLLLGLTGIECDRPKAFWVVLGEVLGVGIAWLFMSRRFLPSRNAMIRLLSIILSLVFRDRSQAIRKVAALALVIFVTVYVSAQIDATGKAFEDSELGVLRRHRRRLCCGSRLHDLWWFSSGRLE